MIFVVTWATWVLLCLVAMFITLIFLSDNDKDNQMEPPGPRKYPVIGSVPYMARFSNNVEAFATIGKEFGDIASLKLGSVNSLVVSGLENIRQVLVTRAQYFDSRPGFKRFDMLFEGDRNNSLAFADWSENQKKRREVVGYHAFAKKGSVRFDTFQGIATSHIEEMVETLKSNVSKEGPTQFIKRNMSESIMKIFLKYMCGLDVNAENEADFLQLVETFDSIFQEMNTSCIGDIFPTIMPICQKGHLEQVGHPVRQFVMKYCVEPRKAAQNADSNNNEVEKMDTLLDSFLDSVGQNNVTEESALFALEDMLGGHAAIANMLTTAFLFIGQNPEIQTKIQKEVSDVFGNGPISLTEHLSYTESVVWESVRHICSPLVPHVANQDTHLGDFQVKKGTVLFLNNGELNFSSNLWTEPEKFVPERFLKGGQVLKPDFYFPFGTGRRSCLGFKLLMHVAILTIANVCTSFDIGVDASNNYSHTLGSLAVPDKGFSFQLKPLTK